jgi:nucleoside triphosphate diphosphatase
MPDLSPLTNLMAALRDPETGCPWDIKQTSTSIASYTLEETYELLHAIESGDIEHTKEELGDLLFHIVFHAQIASENQQFDINDVIKSIVEKMTYRHPHVFDKERDNQLDDEALKQQWANLKQKDKKNSSRVLDEVAQKLPAMMRAQKLQDVAAEYYFDWPDAMPVLDKIEEEIAELREAMIQGDQQHVRSEMGDILFACINLARHVDVDAESALRNTNEKFIHRFDYVVEQMQRSGTDFTPEQLDLMEKFWQQSKTVTV